MKWLGVIAFVLMVLAQWLVPAKMIADSESVVSDGTLYKFKTLPIDPSDPFRGKYITLNFDADHLDDTTVRVDPGDEVYVTFVEDADGFATPQAVALTPPDADAYLQTTVTYESGGVYFVLPFDRYYLEESKASDAEQAYWQAQRDSTQVAYALVKIRKGQAVLTDVMINNKSIVDIVNELNRDEQ